MGRRKQARLTIHLVCLGAVVLLCAAAAQLQADLTLVGETEGFLTARHDIYYRVFHFNEPASTTWWAGPAHTWEWKTWSLQGMWIYESQSNQAYHGPELWPTWTKGKLSIDSEFRYLFGFDDNLDQFIVVPTALWQISPRTSIGLTAFGERVVGGDSPPWTIGPEWSYVLNDELTLLVYTQQNVSGHPDYSLWVDLVRIPQ